MVVTYEVLGDHIYVYFSYPPDNVTKQILQMNYAYQKPIKGRNAWVLANNSQNLQLVKSLIPPPPPPPDPLPSLPHHAVGLKDVLVRGDSFRCSNHRKQEYAGEVPVLVRNGFIETYLIPIWYCVDCQCYFILEQTFHNLKQKGVIICKITDYKTFKSYHPLYNIPSSQWNVVSPLRLCGYCVNQQEDLTDEQRHGILEEIIDSGILDKAKVLSYLSFFMRNPRAGQNAMSKWRADYKHISSYKIGSAKRVVIKGFCRL